MPTRRLPAVSSFSSTASLAWPPLMVAAVFRAVEKPAEAVVIVLALAAGIASLTVVGATLSGLGGGEGPAGHQGEPPVERALRALRTALGWGLAVATAACPVSWAWGLFSGHELGLLNASLWGALACFHAGLAVIVFNALGAPSVSPERG